MANAKISQLPLATTPVVGTEVLPIVQSGQTVRVSIDNLTNGKAVSTSNLNVVGTASISGNFAVNTTKFTVAASSGNTITDGTLDVAGDFAIATNKFNVTATSGDTTVAGTLGVTDDFAVNTDKFTVEAATGNTAFEGDLAINTDKFTVTAASGNTEAAGTLSATGDFAINTNKFTVAAASGNTAAAGTLSAVGNFAINTDKFTVTAANGNTLVAGSLDVTGLTTLTGGIVGGVQSLSGAGAVNLTTVLTVFTSTATGNALTLSNGIAGQIKTIAYVSEAAGADTGILTPTTPLGFSTITFNAIGDTATLQYTSVGWVILAVRGATVA